MSFLAGILTFLLIVNCGVLILLVLVQLPKKDAGVGLAFGGGAADALFGAGSGNALTKITKWATVAFVLLCIILGSVEVKSGRGTGQEIEQGIERQQEQQQTQTRAPQMAPQQGAPAHSAGSQPDAAPATSPSSTPVLPLPATTNGK